MGILYTVCTLNGVGADGRYQACALKNDERVTMVITLLRVLITPLLCTHEPANTSFYRSAIQSLSTSERVRQSKHIGRWECVHGCVHAWDSAFSALRVFFTCNVYVKRVELQEVGRHCRH